MLSVIATEFTGRLAKGLVSVWFRDKTILEAASESVAAAIDKKTDSLLEKRKAERLIAEIEDQLIDKIARFLENEYGKRKKGDLKVIVGDAVNYLNTPRFYDLCFDLALDQVRITDDFVSQNRGAPTRLAVPTDLYRNVTSYVIGQYLKTIERLPGFEKSTLKVILRDTDEILERIRAIEYSLSEAREATAGVTEKSDVEFRRIISKRFERIPIFGIDARGLKKSYDLSIAYINLNFTDVSEPATESTESLLVTAIAADSRIVIVQGDPGSGKQPFCHGWRSDSQVVMHPRHFPSCVLFCRPSSD